MKKVLPLSEMVKGIDLIGKEKELMLRWLGCTVKMNLLSVKLWKMLLQNMYSV